MPKSPPRLIDLSIDWLLQYAPELDLFDPALSGLIPPRLGQLDGYLGATRAAFLTCDAGLSGSRGGGSWAELSEQLARIEAEFPGRLLMAPDDHARWLDDPGGLTWGVLGIGGLDSLIRRPDDLDRFPDLFDRGARLFRPAAMTFSARAGSRRPGDDQGPGGFKLDLLPVLAGLAASSDGPRPILDLAGMGSASASAALDWFEAEPGRGERLIPIISRFAPPRDGSDSPHTIPTGIVARLRALGGVVGIGINPPDHEDAATLKAGIEAVAALPFRGRPGFEGIALSTGFLGSERSHAGPGNAPELLSWVATRFDPAAADAMLQGSAADLIARAVGVRGR